MSTPQSAAVGNLDDTIDQQLMQPNRLVPVRLFNYFSPGECDGIIGMGESLCLAPGRMVTPAENYRQCQVAQLAMSATNDWLANKALNIARVANSQYALDIDTASMQMHYVRYEPGGLIGWHSDYDSGGTLRRKLSVSVQLSDHADYEGGGLEFFSMGELPLTRSRGTVVAFPSFLMHRVDKIASGVRSALVIWFSGPQLR